MKSSGVEVTLSTTNIKLGEEAGNFRWTTDFTFSYTNNKITKLDSRVNVMSLVSGSGYAREGYPVRALFSIPFEGLNDEGLPTFLNQDGVVTVTDINFQEIENTSFLKYEGPTDPTITGGFGNVFSWKVPEPGTRRIVLSGIIGDNKLHLMRTGRTWHILQPQEPTIERFGFEHDSRMR